MADFLNNLFLSGSWLWWLNVMPSGPGLPPEAVSISALSSGAGALILGKFTTNIGFITMPINYCALLVGALIANVALGGLELPALDPRLQAPVVYAVMGMTIAALSMMAMLKRE